MNKQELLNALTEIEDKARVFRDISDVQEISTYEILNLIVQLAKLIRQEFIK